MEDVMIDAVKRLRSIRTPIAIGNHILPEIIDAALADIEAENARLRSERDELKQCCNCEFWRDCDYESCSPDMRCENNKSKNNRRSTHKFDKCEKWMKS